MVNFYQAEMRRRMSEQQIVIWIAGLLSTDGSVIRRYKDSRRYFIYSVEKDWLEAIGEKVSQLGFPYTINENKEYLTPEGMRRGYYLEILKNGGFTGLLRKYGLGWMIDRKWKRVTEWRVEDREVIKRLRADPSFFMEKLFKVKFYPYQAEKIGRAHV